MLLTIGKYAMTIAAAFAIGTFFGREHPSDSGVANWYEQQLGPDYARDLENSFKEAIDDLEKVIPSSTPSP